MCVLQVHVPCTESVMGQFNVRHAAVVDRLALLAFMRNLSLLVNYLLLR